MRSRLLAILSALAVTATGIVLLSSAAVAAPPPTPTDPYPAVPINQNVCRAEKIKVDQAKLLYDQALRDYERAVAGGNAGVVSAQERRRLRKALGEASIALNSARYAQAKCQNTAANPANRNCVDLTLELNRLVDELVITRDLEQTAKEEAEAAAALRAAGTISQEEYQRAVTAYEVAKLQTQYVEQLIADQRVKTTAANCQNVDRPAPPPATPAPSSPAPSSPAPSTPAPSSPAPTSTSAAPSPPVPSATV